MLKGLIFMKNMSGSAALIAGEGVLPEETARQMVGAGMDVTVYSFTGGAEDRFPFLPKDRVLSLLSLPGCEGKLSLQALLADLRTRGILSVCMAGLIPKTIMYGDGTADSSLLGMLSPGTNDDHSLLGRIVAAFESFGLQVLPYAGFVGESLAAEGFLAGREPSDNEREDVSCGKRILSVTLPLSFGQSVVVARGAVVAVEAMEGTDEMIRRAGKLLSGAPGVVVKMMRPDQDIRFDLPTVGTGTLRAMSAAGLTCLAVEAGRTIILDRPGFASLAESLSIAVEGITP
ncbi:MAG: UDP-2,3-diacylglucosamine hydrolase [Synergistaceae bacterium]|nr:UDP-2,3-diacylglucosamine hydrolase [Synergistaceae bacterium]